MIKSRELKQAIRAKFAWPGGYEIFGITSDGAVLCCDCMRQEYRQIAYARFHRQSDGWLVTAVDCAANYDSDVSCEHCNKAIVETEFSDETDSD